MWRPLQRMKWRTSPQAWPTHAEVAGSLLFSPIQVGPLQLSSRTWVPAMVPWRATPDGYVTSANLEWYKRFAQGRPAVIVIEATAIRDIPSGSLLRIGDDRFIPGLRELVRTVHEASDGFTHVFIQLIDFLAIRRRPDPATYFSRHLQIRQHHRDALGMPLAKDEQVRVALARLSKEELRLVLDFREFDALEMGHRERVTDVHLPHIRDLPYQLPDLFGRAASRAKSAGFDGIELHYAHAYTMSSFLSALNTGTTVGVVPERIAHVCLLMCTTLLEK